MLTHPVIFSSPFSRNLLTSKRPKRFRWVGKLLGPTFNGLVFLGPENPEWSWENGGKIRIHIVFQMWNEFLHWNLETIGIFHHFPPCSQRILVGNSNETLAISRLGPSDEETARQDQPALFAGRNWRNRRCPEKGIYLGVSTISMGVSAAICLMDMNWYIYIYTPLWMLSQMPGSWFPAWCSCNLLAPS